MFPLSQLGSSGRQITFHILEYCQGCPQKCSCYPGRVEMEPSPDSASGRVACYWEREVPRSLLPAHAQAWVKASSTTSWKLSPPPSQLLPWGSWFPWSRVARVVRQWGQESGALAGVRGSSWCCWEVLQPIGPNLQVISCTCSRQSLPIWGWSILYGGLKYVHTFSDAPFKWGSPNLLSWVWAALWDLLLTNRIRQKWWYVTPETRS